MGYTPPAAKPIRTITPPPAARTVTGSTPARTAAASIEPAKTSRSAAATAAIAALPSTAHKQVRYTALSAPTTSGRLYSSQPFLSRVGGLTGIAEATGASSNTTPIVAVIDTGFALNHIDLSARWTALKYDFVHGDSTPQAGSTDPNGASVFHGTMTAGLAGLLDPLARIMPLQVLDDDGVGYTDDVAAAVRYAADNGAKVISLSLGSTEDDPYLRQQIDYAISKGALVVAAAGNDGATSGVVSYPGAYPEVLSVGAVTSSDTQASFSDSGPAVDVVAPGTASDVCSTFYSATNATSSYSCSYSGTSFSTPIVSGLAALLLQQNPNLGEDELIKFITQNADKVSSMGGSDWTSGLGYGRIDVAKAVAAVSLTAPTGQLLSRATDSLSSNQAMTSTCVGVPGASCDIKLTGPTGQIVDLGAQTLSSATDGAIYSWNPTTLNLAAGTWTVTATETVNGQTITSPTASLTISP